MKLRKPPPWTLDAVKIGGGAIGTGIALLALLISAQALRETRRQVDASEKALRETRRQVNAQNCPVLLYPSHGTPVTAPEPSYAQRGLSRERYSAVGMYSGEPRGTPYSQLGIALQNVGTSVIRVRRVTVFYSRAIGAPRQAFDMVGPGKEVYLAPEQQARWLGFTAETPEAVRVANLAAMKALRRRGYAQVQAQFSDLSGKLTGTLNFDIARPDAPGRFDTAYRQEWEVRPRTASLRC